jgi:hypothetical protein
MRLTSSIFFSSLENRAPGWDLWSISIQNFQKGRPRLVSVELKAVSSTERTRQEHRLSLLLLGCSALVTPLTTTVRYLVLFHSLRC